MPQLRSLPRSLAPLPGESLVGFLLRLAHHNNVSPGTIVSRTGVSAHLTALTEHIPLSQQYLQTPEHGFVHENGQQMFTTSGGTCLRLCSNVEDLGRRSSEAALRWVDSPSSRPSRRRSPREHPLASP
ncbi:TniQ family protein [Streptomyces griseoviridis]|uniref:TniQ family protein n=1 Tax=Streptomyces griseoviridis TaxID=45398 RepID=UPI0033FFE6F7